MNEVFNKERPAWIRVIDEELIESFLGVADVNDDYESASQKLAALIQWHISIATDPKVNGGWKLVPMEPTPEMKQAALEVEIGDNTEINPSCFYKAMIAASPDWDCPKLGGESSAAPGESIPARAAVLREVEQIITRERVGRHGEPEDSFRFIADYWTVYLRHKGKLVEAVEITAEDVAALMGLLKRGRADGNPRHGDSYKDLIGYAAAEYELIQKQ